MSTPGRAVYSIYTSPNHAPVPDHLPTLIVTPSGKPQHILYTYLHTNFNQENYLLTPSPNGDLCIAKLFPSSAITGAQPSSSTSAASFRSTSSQNEKKKAVFCEASRALKWSMTNTGISMPTYKLTLPSAEPDDGSEDQPLFQVSKTNRASPYWTLWYYTYSGHLVPPNRIEFGRIEKASTDSGGGTRVVIAGQSEAEKAVWQTLGAGNADMVEWIVLCAALNVLDDEIRQAAKEAGQPLRAPPSSPLLGGNLAQNLPFASKGTPSSTVSDGPRSQQPKRSLEASMQGVSLRDEPRSASAQAQHRPPPGATRDRTTSNPPDPRRAVQSSPPRRSHNQSLPTNHEGSRQMPILNKALPPASAQKSNQSHVQPPPSKNASYDPRRGPPSNGMPLPQMQPSKSMPPQQMMPPAPNANLSSYKPLPPFQQQPHHAPPSNPRPGAYQAQGGPLPNASSVNRMPPPGQAPNRAQSPFDPRRHDPRLTPSPQLNPPTHPQSSNRRPVATHTDVHRSGPSRNVQQGPPAGTPQQQTSLKMSTGFQDSNFYQLPRDDSELAYARPEREPRPNAGHSLVDVNLSRA